MIKTIVTTRLFRFFTRKQLSVGEHPMFLPARDWQVMVITTAVIALAVFAFASYMFFQIENRSFFSSVKEDETPQPPALDKHTLTVTVDYYEQKSTQQQLFRSEALATFDPFN